MVETIKEKSLIIKENGKIIKSYYLCFMQVTKTHIYTNLNLTTHFHQEDWSDVPTSGKGVANDCGTDTGDKSSNVLLKLGAWEK